MLNKTFLTYEMFTPSHSEIDSNFSKNQNKWMLCCISYERQSEGSPQTLIQNL